MDISSVNMNYSDIIGMISDKIEEYPDIEAQYAVKLLKMVQQSSEIVGSILEDTVEISQEAMQRFMSERA